MPKKKAPTYNTKPSSPAHPSLSSSGKPRDAHSLGSTRNLLGTSVNDQIQRLRISQDASRSLQESPPKSILSQGLGSAAGPTLPPPLRRILQLPDAPLPRPRPSLRVTGRARGPPGPAPPASWVSTREQATRLKSKGTRVPLGETGAKIEQLPGCFLPDHGSLAHTALKALATNWDWHVHYDQYYLATIPIRYKEALLSYIARYSPCGTDKAGLTVLFRDDAELEDATGVEGLTCLDLSTSLGHQLKLKHLKDFLGEKKAVPGGEETSDVIPESWDTPELLKPPSGLPRLHSLTHLSLSHPNHAVTWKGLLDLAPNLMTVTHLSLAYWPTPTLSPNSTTAYRETPQGNVNYGASNFYSVFDGDWDEAASILRRLSKSTYCLKWLDLTGCYPWVQALAHDLIDWCGAWRALETIKIGQGYIPQRLQDEAAEPVRRDIDRDMKSLLNHGLSISYDSHQTAQMAEWLRVETVTTKVEESVNARISELIKKASRFGVDEREGASPAQKEEDDDNEGSDGGWAKVPSVAIVAATRSQRVVFDRGWDSWRIRDAVRDADLQERWLSRVARS